MDVGGGMARQPHAVEMALLSNELTQLGRVGVGCGFWVTQGVVDVVAFVDVDVVFEVVVQGGLLSKFLSSRASRTRYGAAELVADAHAVIAADLETAIRKNICKHG